MNTTVKDDLDQIKETLKNMQENIAKIAYIKLCEIDAEMNELLKKATRASEDDKVYIMRRVNFLNKKYTDLFLASQLDEPHESEEMTEFVENYTQEL